MPSKGMGGEIGSMGKANVAKNIVGDIVRGWAARVGANTPAAPAAPTRSYKLFVDDMRETPAGWIGCRTVSETLAILACLPVSEISLDHDIIAGRPIGSNYQALSQETYRGVAYYIALMPADRRPKVRIHTANAGAAKSMCEVLGLRFEDTYKHYAPENY